jgi:transcriptional regulator with XRE-family HTH domain
MKNKEPECQESTLFRERFKNIRRRSRLTHKRIHELTGISKNHISLIERGLRRPSIEVASRLARAIGTTLVELVTAEHASFHMHSISKAGSKDVQPITQTQTSSEGRV